MQQNFDGIVWAYGHTATASSAILANDTMPIFQVDCPYKTDALGTSATTLAPLAHPYLDAGHLSYLRTDLGREIGKHPPDTTKYHHLPKP
jgi:hypothetical protein